MTTKREAVTGTVRHIIAERAQRNGGKWIAGRLKTSSGENVSFSCVGDCAVGDEITMHGTWEDHARYGRQFKGAALSLTMPVNAEGLSIWLARNVRSIGPITAEKLIKQFGVDLPALCQSHPDKVAADGEISLDAVLAIGAAWELNGGRLAAMTWLLGTANLSERLATNALDRLGTTVVRTIQEDPYSLIGRVGGFGWKTTDELAERIGISGTDRRRLRGSLSAVVRETEETDGNTCVSVKRAMQLASEKIRDATPEMFTMAVEDAVAKNELVLIDGDTLALKECLQAEKAIWAALLRSREPNPIGVPNEEEARALAEQFRVFDTVRGLSFDDEQMNAVVNALRFRISVVCGGAGAGKSALISAMIRCFDSRDVLVHLCAPTGKAARRMTELTGHGAQTLHRMLRYNGGTGQFMASPLDPLEDGVVICDEMSMTDAGLAAKLLSAVSPRSSIVFVGDPNQLPPVGEGAVLRDILAHELAPITRLRNSHRQADPLKLNSVAILSSRVEKSVPANENEPPPWAVEASADTPEKVYGLVKKLYRELLPRWNVHPIRETQFMSAQKSGPFGVNQLNLLLQHLHQTALDNPISEPDSGAHKVAETPVQYVGDKVIQTKNNYTLNVMNGEIGIVTGLNLRMDDLMERFAPPDFDAPSSDVYLITPIIPGEEGIRRCLCPVCSATSVIDREGGYVEMACGNCGSTFAATDGTRQVSTTPPRRRTRQSAPTISHVVDFYDRTVVYPMGEGGDLQLAYCLTAHKMQGSQIPCAITVVPKAHHYMQTQNWLYTAVTRASRSSVILGDMVGILTAASKVTSDSRETLLRLFAQRRPVLSDPVPVRAEMTEDETFSLAEGEQ